MTLTLYGITNCDTVKKARAWLEAEKLDYAFHDTKKAGADAARLARWCDQLGWETVLNRAGKLSGHSSNGQLNAGPVESQPSSGKRPSAIPSHGLPLPC